MTDTLLTIAGTDPSGGAGIQVDLQTFRDFDFHGLSVVTAVVAQNTRDVRSFEAVERIHLADQIEAIFDDIRPAAVKVGMVPTPSAAEVIGGKLPGFQGADARPVVYDPVLASGTGESRLVRRGTRESIVESLVPKVDWLLPNITEAQDLLKAGAKRGLFADDAASEHGDAETSGEQYTPAELADQDPKALTRRNAEEIARYLRSLGPSGVVITGGHLPAARTEAGLSDLISQESGATWTEPLEVATGDARGTGCQLSSSFCAKLARAAEPAVAFNDARAYLNDLLHNHVEYIGTGRPVVVRSRE